MVCDLACDSLHKDCCIATHLFQTSLVFASNTPAPCCSEAALIFCNLPRDLTALKGMLLCHAEDLWSASLCLCLLPHVYGCCVSTAATTGSVFKLACSWRSAFCCCPCFCIQYFKSRWGRFLAWGNTMQCWPWQCSVFFSLEIKAIDLF